MGIKKVHYNAYELGILREDMHYNACFPGEKSEIEVFLSFAGVGVRLAGLSV